MKNRKNLFLYSGFVALFLGTICSYFTLGSMFSVLIWVLGGMLIGYLAENNKEIIINSLVYGATLSLSYLILSYDGGRDKILSYIILCIVFAIPGVIGAWVSIQLGNFIKKNL